MHLANGHILKTRSQHTPRHATNNTRVHCTLTRCGRYKQSSQWKPNSNWTIDELKLLLNELKRVQSSFNCNTRHFNCQTPLPPHPLFPHSFNPSKVHQSFMWSNHNYSIACYLQTLPFVVGLALDLP